MKIQKSKFHAVFPSHHTGMYLLVQKTYSTKCLRITDIVHLEMLSVLWCYRPGLCCGIWSQGSICRFENNVAVEPGDELRVTCTYTSKNRGAFTYFGDATSEEMCYAIILYYPYISTGMIV